MRVSAAVQVHRTASHERSPPPRLRSETRAGSTPFTADISDGARRRGGRVLRNVPVLRMERATGFEPATSTLARLHSTTELRPRPGPRF